jgi:hypothetical protein
MASPRDLLNLNKLFRFIARHFIATLVPLAMPGVRFSNSLPLCRMTSTSLSLADRLQTAIDLAQTLDGHSQAQKAFQDLVTEVDGQNPLVATLLRHLWKEYLASQRSSLFWEQLSTVEKQLSDQLTASHLQLKQNYLRLIQEQ